VSFFEAKSDYAINNERGSLRAQWNTELEAEEGKGYIPDGYDKKV